MKNNIKEWYLNKYPDDELGQEINSKLTFEDIDKELNKKNHQDIEDMLNVGDSIIRERVFEELASLLKVDYDDIYYKWLEIDKKEEATTNYEKIDNKSDIKKIIQDLGSTRGIYRAFYDVVICCAYSLANAVVFSQDREDNYMRIINNYNKEEQKSISKILASLFKEHQKIYPKDILGELYEEFELYNKHNGQFFTPQSICDLMAKTTIGSKDELSKKIEDKGFIAISDPSCGSGRLLFSAYNTLIENGVDSKDIFLQGDDIDILCCCIAYIELSLMGANAIINHQDSLTNDRYDTFYTMNYAINNDLQDKLFKEKLKIESEEIEV